MCLCQTEHGRAQLWFVFPRLKTEHSFLSTVYHRLAAVVSVCGCAEACVECVFVSPALPLGGSSCQPVHQGEAVCQGNYYSKGHQQAERRHHLLPPTQSRRMEPFWERKGGIHRQIKKHVTQKTKTQARTFRITWESIWTCTCREVWPVWGGSLGTVWSAVRRPARWCW